MKPWLDWARANPVTLGSGVVAILSVVFLATVNSSGRLFIDQMSRRNQEIRHVRSLLNTPVRVPPAVPDDPEVEINIAVNQAAIDQLSRVYDRMGREYTEIFKLAVEHNRRGHTPMIEGLLPEPADASKPFEVREAYRAAFEAMLGAPTTGAIYPRLNADSPPGPTQINAVLTKITTNYLNNNFFPPKNDMSELNELQMTELNALKGQRLVELLQEKAHSIHLYADTQITSLDFPFDVGAWSKPGLRPRLSQIWVGQLGLWIQQDIARAIALTNHVEDSKASVVAAPVKRLISIRVLPGYVGFQGYRGGVHENAGEPRSRRRIQRQPGPGAAPLSGTASTGHIPDNFSDSPTGRRSNAMYDVVHAKVSLIIDTQAMPVFFENLRIVNFMTILKANVTGVDEYEALRDGYIYGTGDVAQLDLLIETIWLRDWTTKLMPESVRGELGIEPGV